MEGQKNSCANKKVKASISCYLSTSEKTGNDVLSLIKSKLGLLNKYSRLLKIGTLYILLFAGGLWHIFGMFQDTMETLASPIIIGLGILLFYEQWQSEMKNRSKLIVWCLLVLIGSWLAEWIGIQTGNIFGNYTYGKTLYPAIDQVPITIGFAWLVILLSSFAVVQRFLNQRVWKNIFMFSFCVSSTMVGFDLLMEPAATKLAYWNWAADQIPIRNYIAWFSIGFVFSFSTLLLGIFRDRNPNTMAVHVYFGQLIYFAMVSFGK